jgi:ABC-type glycerol-3-phosphate transport system permease component
MSRFWPRLLSALLLYGLLAVGLLLALAPLLWMVAASLMPPGEANRYPPRR